MKFETNMNNYTVNVTFHSLEVEKTYTARKANQRRQQKFNLYNAFFLGLSIIQL